MASVRPYLKQTLVEELKEKLGKEKIDEKQPPLNTYTDTHLEQVSGAKARIVRTQERGQKK